MKSLRTIICMACLLLAMSAGAHAQNADPSVELLEFYAFDPTAGKQLQRETFNWPSQRRIGALVRYQTKNYDKRKTAQVFLTLKDRSGNDLFRDNKEFTIHSGEHEYVFPLDFDMRRMYLEERFKIDLEIKLTGGNKVSSQIEITVNGPVMPDVSISELKLVDPVTLKPLEKVSAGQMVRLTGNVSVSGNTTDVVPTLMVWGRMSNEDLQVEPWEEAPFSDVYRDSATFTSPNGSWNFGINAKMPDKFRESQAASQPYEFKIVVYFTRQSVRSTEISGTVSESATGSLVGDDLDERLIRVERNWHWELVPQR
ncbi:MAG: hypothetical protein H7A35_01250 [Planctomycetales bacterium]|nr:hypothetical protein [bacterium]UNM08686.1 MAG: hypothetical protein H7A35_01250 [Planctomycetales bacterium]